MGRGRAKAKQTKVARDLKYRTHETDFGALARELHGSGDSDEPAASSGSPEPDDDLEGLEDYDDTWSDYADRER